MTTSKRCLLWDWTNTANNPSAIDKLNFANFASVANWNAWAPPELKGRLPFRPTVRGMGQITDANEWGMISNNDHEIVHYFNEPERAGIKVQEAVDLWIEKMVPLRKEKSKKLVGPACASDGPGEEWFNEFMKKVEGLGEPPDYLSVHYYGPKSDAAIEYIQKMHDKYPSYLVVVSEIGCISRERQEVFAFTSELTNWMDECPYIFEYAWFGCMAKVADTFVSPEAQLMDADGNFTSLMEKLMNERPMTVN